MLTMLYTILLTGLIAAPVLLFFLTVRKQKQKELNQLLLQFRQAGEAHALTLSSQDVLKDSIIGIDGIHRKMLVVERTGDESFRTNVINFQDIQNCFVGRQYGTNSSSGGDTVKREQHPEKIYLQLDLSGKASEQIIFYQRHKNADSDIRHSEAKAHRWAMILSKLEKPLEKTG